MASHREGTSYQDDSRVSAMQPRTKTKLITRTKLFRKLRNQIGREVDRMQRETWDSWCEMWNDKAK